MDSNDLERERGITILSKNTAVRYKVSHQQITSKRFAQVLRAGQPADWLPYTFRGRQKARAAHNLVAAQSVAAGHCLLESTSVLCVHYHAGYPC